MTKPISDKPSQVTINLDRNHPHLTLEQAFGQRPRSRSNLKDSLAWLEVGSVHQLKNLAVIVQEILPEPMARRQTAGRQQFSDFSQRLHLKPCRGTPRFPY